MAKGMHPLIMIGLVAAVTLCGRVLPTWTLSLATIAAVVAFAAPAMAENFPNLYATHLGR